MPAFFGEQGRVMDDCKNAPDAAAPHASLLATAAGDPVPGPFVPLRLAVAAGGDAIELNRPEIVVGRHSDADIRLPLPDVSRHHARFVFAGGVWQVFDMQSTNGLYVNEERVDQAHLHQNDQVRIGSYIFLVDLATEQADEAELTPRTTLRTLESIAQVLPRPICRSEEPKRKAS
jgi:hypothetical protein